MSGLQIFNAHPRLYWGEYGANADPAFIQIGSGHAPGQKAFSRSGSPSRVGRILAGGRRWHFFLRGSWFSTARCTWLVSFASGHVRRDLLPTRAEISPAHVARDF